jgi:hypothetical protein
MRIRSHEFTGTWVLGRAPNVFQSPSKRAHQTVVVRLPAALLIAENAACKPVHRKLAVNSLPFYRTKRKSPREVVLGSWKELQSRPPNWGCRLSVWQLLYSAWHPYEGRGRTGFRSRNGGRVRSRGTGLGYSGTSTCLEAREHVRQATLDDIADPSPTQL